MSEFASRFVVAAVGGFLVLYGLDYDLGFFRAVVLIVGISLVGWQPEDDQ